MLSCYGTPSICVLLPIRTAVPALICSILCSCESHTTDICIKCHLKIILDILYLELLMQWQIMTANLLLSHSSYAHLVKFIRPSVGS